MLERYVQLELNLMLIKANKEIIVHNSLEKIFDFYSNPANDYLWRKEINQTELKGDLHLGTHAYEYSKLSTKKANNLVVLEFTEFKRNETVTLQSIKDSRFYLKSVRTVQYISENRTRLIYEIEFDSSIVKYALGFNLPKFIIAMKTNFDMKKYLSKLKSILEPEN
ncbi:MAG: hypothetical protein JST02_05125 [Bacteroidetes bacterium]|nr:hypothetical protein [Bacteroidota bacterium]